MDKIGWFFFQLLVLGSVEDFKSGCAFQLHKNAKWEVYIEVYNVCLGGRRYVCVHAHVVWVCVVFSVHTHHHIQQCSSN